MLTRSPRFFHHGGVRWEMHEKQDWFVVAETRLLLPGCFQTFGQGWDAWWWRRHDMRVMIEPRALAPPYQQPGTEWSCIWSLCVCVCVCVCVKQERFWFCVRRFSTGLIPLSSALTGRSLLSTLLPSAHTTILPVEDGWNDGRSQVIGGKEVT